MMKTRRNLTNWRHVPPITHELVCFCESVFKLVEACMFCLWLEITEMKPSKLSKNIFAGEISS